MSKKIIRVVICEPEKEPYVKRIEKSKEAIDKILGGEAKGIPWSGYILWHTYDEEIDVVEEISKKNTSRKFVITGKEYEGELCSVYPFIISAISGMFTTEDAFIEAELKADNKPAKEEFMLARKFEKRFRSFVFKYSNMDIKSIYDTTNVELLKEIYFGIHRAFEESYNTKDVSTLDRINYFLYPLIAETEDGNICLAVTVINKNFKWEPGDEHYFYNIGVSTKRAPDRVNRLFGFEVEDLKNAKLYAIDEFVQKQINAESQPSDTLREIIDEVTRKWKGEESNG